jgi:hypothetical protein
MDFGNGTGTRAEMLSTLKGRNYVSYNCEPVSNSDVTDAETATIATENAGYNLTGNNCLDHAYRILSAYNASGLPMPDIFLLPNAWFLALPTTSGSGWSILPMSL